EVCVPELPEVETVVRELRPLLVGRRLAAVESSDLPLRTPWSADWAQSLVGRRVKEVRRRGKWIVVALDRGLHLVFHLGMTGQLVVAPAKEPRLPPTHLGFALARGAEQLRFRDIRRFGSARVLLSPEAVEDFFEATGLGPEPFDLDPKYWRERLSRTERCL